MIYNFGAQLVKGEAAERELDTHFSEWFAIRRATRAEQRSGIDRVFTRKRDGKITRVEYKADWKASQTGNAFVEIISVDTTNKLGWALSSNADRLAYYLPTDSLVYWFAMAGFKSLVDGWRRDYDQRAALNEGYKTIGILVPLHELEEHADNVLNI